MAITALPADWAEHRVTLQRVATHVLARWRKARDNLFDLEPAVGGFATPLTGPDRARLRVSGDLLVIERASGPSLDQLDATTTTARVGGSTLGELCALVGVTPDPAFSTGRDTAPLDPVDEPLALDPRAGDVLGEWYLLGRRAIDRVVASVERPEASLGRLWPEHFDYGIDVAARPGARVNLGASAGDGHHPEPYLYVAPWDEERPGDGAYWNAPFGALLAHDDLAAAGEPLERATSFLLTGIERLAGR
jgi:hypothetical protein